MATTSAEDLRLLQQGTVPYSPASSTSAEDLRILNEGTVPYEGAGVPEKPKTYVTQGQALREFGHGLVEGGISSGPVLGGMVGGARLGAMAAPYTGPAAPYMPAIGAVAGGITGAVTGKSLEDLYREAFPLSDAADASVYRRSGQATGSAATFIPGAWALPATSANQVNFFMRQLGKIGETARKYPKTFIWGEGHAALGSGLGAGVAESVAPGDPLAAFEGEVAGGLLSPTSWATKATMTSLDALRAMKSSFSKNARESQAADYLQKIIEESGESIDKLVPRLQENLKLKDARGNPVQPSAGQKTGSVALTMLERMLGNKSPAFSGENAAQGNKALQAYALLIENMRKIGSPDAMKTAAQMEKELFEFGIQNRLSAANQKAATKIANITQDTPEAKSAIGNIIATNTQSALEDARAYESALWQEAYKRMAQAPKVEYPELPRVIKKIDFFKTTDPETGIEYLRHGRLRNAGYDGIGHGDHVSIYPGMQGRSGPYLRNLDDAFTKVKDPETGKMVLALRPDVERSVHWNMGLLDTKTPEIPKIQPTETLNTYLTELAKIDPALRKKMMPPEIRQIMERLGADSTAIAVFSDRMRKGLLEQTQVIEGVPIGPNGQPIPKLDAKNTDVYNLLNLRSNLLSLARESAGKAEVNNARIYGDLAESLYRDIAGVAQQAKNPEAVAAFDAAREFSRTLNDVFTRTFAAMATRTAPGAVTQSGAARIPPEILVQRAFSSGADITAMRMTDMMKAVRLIKTTYDDVVSRFGKESAQAKQLEPLFKTSTTDVAGTNDAMQRILRLAAAEAIDPTTGRLNVNRLNKFIYNNKATLQKFGLLNDLTDAVRAENALTAAVAETSSLSLKAKKEQAWARILDNENPVRVLSDALNSRTPVKGVQNLAKLAAQGGQNSIDGLKSTMYDYAFEKAGGVDNFNPKKYYDIMFDQIVPNGPSLVNIMRTQGLMTVQEGNNLKRLLYPMQRIEQSMESKRMLEPGGRNMKEMFTDMASELALRISGSELGSYVASKTPGGSNSMVAPAAGSKYLRDMLQKMPKFFVNQIIQDATKDPELMALLLTQPRSQIDKFRVARGLHAYLAGAGLNYSTFDEKEPAPEQPRPTGPAAGQMLRAMPPAPPTTGLPNLFNRLPSPPPKPGGAPGPQSGVNFQSLFPFDSISPMLAARQQPPAPG